MTAAGGWASVPAMAAAAAAAHRHHAVVDGDVRLTYPELHEAARSFGAALVASGVAPGDRVAIWAPNGAPWVVALLGALAAGAVVVPVNTRFKGPEAADVLGRSGARVLVTVTRFLGTDYVAVLRESGTALPALATVVVAGGPVPAGAVGWEGFLDRAGPTAPAEVDRRSAALGPDHPCDVLFTSGTTGAPKGVVQTHGRTLGVATDWVAMTGLAAGDRYLMVNPYFHMFGLKAGILASVAAGATMLPEPVFDAGRVLRRVAATRVTVLPGPPTLYQSLLDHPERSSHDLASLRVAVTGAADIPVALVRRVREELPFSLVVTGYGLTEAGTATATSPDDPPETVATTVGRPRPGFQVRVVDGQDRDVPAGEPGEILLRGGSVMSHYLDDPEATARAFATGGWLRTGDLGTLDGAGLLRVVGRSKDMLIVGGFNVYPAEVEQHLLEHPEVRRAAVVGVPDRRLGEVGVAFVVLAPGAAATGEDLVAWARERMANYKAPRSAVVVDDLPLTATGKVHKAALRERAAGPGVRAAGPGEP
ncbi:MAG: FadD3 family acyl-CoA ligase, partial [Acidimicrobiales bacterium]